MTVRTMAGQPRRDANGHVARHRPAHHSSPPVVAGVHCLSRLTDAGRR